MNLGLNEKQTTRRIVAAVLLRSKPCMKRIWSTTSESGKIILRFNWIGEFRTEKGNMKSTGEWRSTFSTVE